MASSGVGSRRILVVDDDPLVADSVRRMLVFEGHQVETAGSAEEALALFAKHQFDLTLVDYEMPKMKGDQLAVAIKALAPDRPIAMLTGYAEAIRGDEPGSKAVDWILGKPFDLGELRRMLAHLIGPK